MALTAVIPLLTHSISVALVDEKLDSLGSIGRSVEVSYTSTDGSGPSTAALAATLGNDWNAVAGAPIASWRTVTTSASAPGAEITLMARQDACAHLSFTSGRCPAGRFEVALSAASARELKLRVGSVVTLDSASPGAPAHVQHPVRVVGILAQTPGQEYWRGIDLTTVTQRVEGLNTTRLHRWLTSEASFPTTVIPTVERSAKPRVFTSANYGWFSTARAASRQLDPDGLRFDSLPQAVAALKNTTAAVAAPRLTGAQLSEQVSTVDERTSADLDQLATLVPLLLVQLSALAALLAHITIRSAIMRRRSDVAVLRLRADGRATASALLRAELLPPLCAALPLGFGLAYLIDALSRHTWLPSGTSGRFLPAAVIIAALAAIALIGVLLWQVRGVCKEPVSQLLRAVGPRRRSLALGAGEAVLLAVAVAAVVGVATGTVSGAPVLLTPLVAAVAVGAIFGGLLAPVGNAVAGRLLRSGRVGGLLGLTSLARRPGTRQLLLAITAAGAMVTFALGAFTLGHQNRERLAQAEVGPPVRMSVSDDRGFRGAADFVKTVRSVDATGVSLAPVVQMRSGSSDGPVLTAGDPAALARITASSQLPSGWSLLPRTASGAALTPAVVADWSFPVNGQSGQAFSAPSLTGVDATYAPRWSLPVLPGLGPHAFLTTLDLDSATANGAVLQVWSDGSDPAALQRVKSALIRSGYGDFSTQSWNSTEEALATSASGYGLRLALVTAGGAALMAALVLLAVRAAQYTVRRADAAALRRAGVSPKALRRGRSVETGLLLAALLLGGAVGLMGLWLAAPSMPWYTTTPDYDITLRRPPFLAPAAALAGVAVVIGVISELLARKESR
ncbi:hypothetical protein ACMYYO_14440 [Dermacoccaceae bacterium W4C1]